MQQTIHTTHYKQYNTTKIQQTRESTPAASLHQHHSISIITLKTTKPLTSTLTPLVIQQQKSVSEIMPDSDKNWI